MPVESRRPHLGARQKCMKSSDVEQLQLISKKNSDVLKVVENGKPTKDFQLVMDS